MTHLALVLVAALTACMLPPASTGAPPPVAAVSGVFINGQRLTADERARFAEAVGEPVPDGRYVLDANGMFGLEGRSERVDLAAHLRARQGTSMTDGRGSTMVGYGNCVSMTTPSGTFMGSGC